MSLFAEIAKGRYLGDGVYASHDGYQVWLAANHHENKVVALEPEVMAALIAYVRDCAAADADDLESAVRASGNESASLSEGK